MREFYIFVIGLRNTQFFRWHLGCCYTEKRPIYSSTKAIGTLNAHARMYGVGCAYLYRCLVVPSVLSVTRVSLFF